MRGLAWRECNGTEVVAIHCGDSKGLLAYCAEGTLDQSVEAVYRRAALKDAACSVVLVVATVAL